MIRQPLRTTIGVVMLVLMALSAAYSFNLLGLRDRFPPPAAAGAAPGPLDEDPVLRA